MVRALKAARFIFCNDWFIHFDDLIDSSNYFLETDSTPGTAAFYGNFTAVDAAN